MANACECPRCGEIELREVNCTIDAHVDDLVCVEMECENCGHFECHWGKG